MMSDLLIAFGFILIAFVVVVAIDLVISFHARKCSRCGKIMKYSGEYVENGETTGFIFKCPHCGSVEYTTFEDVLEKR